MERVFWLMLGGDGASVKNMMEEFQHSHTHSLPETHRKLVLVIQHSQHLHMLACIFSVILSGSHTSIHSNALIIRPSFVLSVVTHFVYWESD